MTNGFDPNQEAYAPLNVADNATAMDALRKAKEAMSSGMPPETLIAMIERGARRKKGRRVPELPEFTFPDSGYTVRIRLLGPWTLEEIRLALRKIRKEPPVPLLKVPDMYNDAGDVTSYRLEPNDADPMYKQQVKEYENWLAEAAGHRLLDIIVSTCIIPDPDDLDPEEVRVHRRALIKAGPSIAEDPEAAAQHRKAIEEMTDEEVFARCMCMRSGRDMTELQRFVTSRSMPTVEEIDQQVTAFRPEV